MSPLRNDLKGATLQKMEGWNNNPLMYFVKFEQKRHLIELPLWPYQARSQKSAIGGGCIGHLGTKPPALEYFVYFGKNNNFRPILIKINAIKTYHKNLQCKNIIILVAYMGSVGKSYC